jgi:flagellar hook protein FlgE
MALTSTLFTGLSGLDVNQTRLNVVGNNIANVNTVAFKSSRAIFTPQFYVTDSAGSPTTAEFGGQNPSQRGLGATVGAIQKDFTAGAIEPTGRATDMAIDGEGFFVVDGVERRFTRDGSFSLNSSNQLVSIQGDFIMGYGVDGKGNIQVGQLEKLSIPLGQATLAQATTKVDFQGNLSNGNGGATVLNSQALTLVGGTGKPTAATLLSDIAEASAPAATAFASGAVITVNGTKGGVALTPATFTVTATSTLQDLLDFYNTSLGIDVGAPSGKGTPKPGAGFKNDSTPPAGNPNAIQLVIAGNLGTANALVVDPDALILAEGATGDNPPISSNSTGRAVITSFIGYDSIGNPLTVNLTATLDSISAAGSLWRFSATSPDNVGAPTTPIGEGTMQFDTNGRLVNSTGTNLILSRQNTGATTPQTISLDFSSLTGLRNTDSTLRFTAQDGFPIGALAAFSVGVDGTIVGNFTNGLNRNLGQLAIATFKNPQGLTDNGGNAYTASAASGVAVVGTPLQLGAGAVRAGALELSNVDLSKEFTSLIVASTGFSAASRVISTSDQLIRELLSTTR